MTNGEAITELNMLQCRFHQIRKSDAAWEAIEMAKDALLAREKSADEHVKHDRWIMRGGYFRCSECDAKSLLRNAGSTGGYREYDQVQSKYCPNCGAKMDGGAEK